SKDQSTMVAQPSTAEDVAPTIVANAEPQHAVERSFLNVQEQRLPLHLPKGREAPIPSVLVFHSAMGRTESVLQWCDRLAARGFAAVALDFNEGKTAASPEEGRMLRDAANHRSAILRGLVEQAWKQMQNHERLLATKRFLLGWSYGGAWATYSTSFLSEVTGVVALYGQAFTDDPNLYKTLHAPILFIGGESDQRPTPAKLQGIVKQLRSKGKAAELLVVPAGHAFAERNHPGHDGAATEKAWDGVIEFLEANAT